MAYLRRMRVERMARRLVSTNLSIAEAARSVSWRNQFHAHVQECLALAGNCQTVYACGSDTTRRMANQVFFTRIYLDADATIRTEPPRPSGYFSTPIPRHKPSPGPSGVSTRASLPLEPSCIMSRVRVRRVEWSSGDR